MPETVMIKRTIRATPDEVKSFVSVCKYMAYDRATESLTYISEVPLRIAENLTVPKMGAATALTANEVIYQDPGKDIVDSATAPSPPTSWEDAIDNATEFYTVKSTGNAYEDLVLAMDTVTDQGLYPTFILSSLSCFGDSLIGIQVIKWDRPGIHVVGSVLPFPVPYDVDMCVCVPTVLRKDNDIKQLIFLKG